MNDIVDTSLTTAQRAVARALRKWEDKMWPDVLFGMNADAGFDGGEWSAPAHIRDYDA